MLLGQGTVVLVRSAWSPCWLTTLLCLLVYTFTIADPENVVLLLFFAVVALIASSLAARVRGRAVAARIRAKTIDELYQFSRKLAVAVTMDDLLWATAHQIALMLKVRVVLLLPEDQGGKFSGLTVRAGFPPEDVLEEADLAAAKWSWETNRVTGRGSDTLPGAKWLFLPMRTGRGSVAVVGIVRDEPGLLLTPDQHRLLDALADQAALGIERAILAVRPARGPPGSRDRPAAVRPTHLDIA